VPWIYEFIITNLFVASKAAKAPIGYSPSTKEHCKQASNRAYVSRTPLFLSARAFVPSNPVQGVYSLTYAYWVTYGAVFKLLARVRLAGHHPRRLQLSHHARTSHQPHLRSSFHHHSTLKHTIMAEVVGIVSAGIGIAAFVVQITSTIDRLKTAYEFNQSKANVELDVIVRRLEVLREILLSLEQIQGPRFVELAINNCQLTYSRADTALQQVTDKLSYLRDRRWRIARHTAEIRDNLEEASLKLDHVNCDLQLALLAQGRALTPPAIADSNTAHIIRSSPTSSALPRQKAFDCTRAHCHCSCHMTRRSSDRFWFFEYSPMFLWSSSCSTSQCTATRYRWSLQFALSNYKIPFKVHTTLEFIAQAGMYSLRPALSVQRVVRYTSPGFETLWLSNKATYLFQKHRGDFESSQNVMAR
jgi:hypothetical protein